MALAPAPSLCQSMPNTGRSCRREEAQIFRSIAKRRGRGAKGQGVRWRWQGAGWLKVCSESAAADALASASSRRQLRRVLWVVRQKALRQTQRDRRQADDNRLSEVAGIGWKCIRQAKAASSRTHSKTLRDIRMRWSAVRSIWPARPPRQRLGVPVT